MPYITPSFLPPAAGLEGLASKFSPSSSTASSLTSTSGGSLSRVSTAPTSPERGRSGLCTESRDARTNDDDARVPERVLSIPALELDGSSISDAMAASLAASLLGHTLFLKSQVPFPVLQLARMPGSASKSRAAKKRTDLINAFDELSSHLHTTFSALSSALAKNSARQASEASGAPVPRANAYLSFVLGPAVGAPRARIMFVVEGLEVRVWGAREEDIGASVTGPVNRAEEEGGSDDVIEGEEDEEDESQEDSEDSDAEDSDEEYFSGESGPSEDEPEEDRPSSEPPSSRSPSPDPPSSAPRHSPPPIGENLPQQPHATPPKGHSGPQLSPERQRSHAEEQQALRAAERLLSRTLLNAYADGGGMAAELSPTQTQVLLRAPRRFSHPAWQPRQNLSVALDPVLASFLDKSGLRASAKAEEANTRRGRKGGVRTEGVVIRCRDADGESEDHADPPLGDESDEMIWWVWTGKLTGFSDW